MGYTLTIANVNPEDNAGSYKCALTFSDGDKLDASTDVVVRKATAIDSKGDVESTIVVSDGELSARCVFEGDQVPNSVKWTKSDSEVVFDNVKKIQNTNTKQLDNSVKYYSNITLKEFAFADEGPYTCTFVFSDGNSVATSINTVYATVTNDECVFVDFRTETSKALTCTYTGANRVTGVTFTLPDSRSVAGDPGSWGGGDTATPGTQTGSYTVTGITDASSGTYTCTFALDGGSSVSAVQRLTARKAVVVSSTGNLTPNLIVRSSITLTCTIASGARSIEWLKDDQVMTEGTDYTKLSAASESDDLVSKIEFDIEDDSAATYKCRGTQYDDFCSTPQKFESEDVVLTIIAAVPKVNPADATAYGGDSHTFSCKFPNPFVGQTYEIVWSFKGAGDASAKPMIGNGDVYVGGEYQCTVKWGTIFIKSSAATLTVRTISEPPKITNVAKGGEAKLTCKTTGDAKSTITFHNADGDAEVGTVAQSDETDSGVVTTTGILTISNAQSANALDYYCKATWNAEGGFEKSSIVHLTVLDITYSTPTAWGVATKVAQFVCKSH